MFFVFISKILLQWVLSTITYYRDRRI